MFFGKKKKKNTELDEAFERVAEGIRLIDEKDNPKKIEHYILDSCEHIIATTKVVESEKAKLRALVDYLEDVDRIVEIDEDTRARLIELVDNVERLTERKKVYSESEKRLSDDAFSLLAEREDMVVTDIKRLEDNEKYRSKVDSDIKFLESEKSRWEIEKDYLKNLVNKLRIVSIGIFGVVVLLLLMRLFMADVFSREGALILLVLMFAGVSGAFIIFLLVGKYRKEYRRALKRLNQSISLLNVERMKYVNVTKAINYEQAVYDVRSSQELSYLWEQYMLTVREREAYRKNNIDLQFYVERLYKVFKQINLKYEKRWLEQVELMLNTREMTALRDRLYARKAEIEEQILQNNKIIDTERDDIDKMMKEHDFYVPEVMEIILSVDKICGRSAINNTGSTFERETA